jgi:hypothetical protein
VGLAAASIAFVMAAGTVPAAAALGFVCIAGGVTALVAARAPC